MSKYIAIIDLPDDSRCNGCPYVYFEEASMESGCAKTKKELRVDDDGDEWQVIRPSDCPLIPVERIIGAVESLKFDDDDADIIGKTDWNDALDCAKAEISKVLGVTE